MSFNFQTWGAAALSQLKDMWWAGVPAGKIALALGASSPRAVKEKALLMGFGVDPTLTGSKVRPTLEPMPRKDGAIVTLRNVNDRECRWFCTGDSSPEAPLCGRPVKRSSYCEEHTRRMFVKSTTGPRT